MADFDLKAESRNIVGMMWGAWRYDHTENNLSQNYLEEAKKEFCKNTPEQRRQLLDFWTKAPRYKDGSGKDVAIDFKGMYVNLNCDNFDR